MSRVVRVIVPFALMLLVRLLPLQAAGEKTLTVGAAAGWSAIAQRDNISELCGTRPEPVLSISTALPPHGVHDLDISFDASTAADFRDSIGNYTVQTSTNVVAVGERWARHGSGAALFSKARVISYYNRMRKAAPIVITPRTDAALFAAGHNIADFSIEFFLFPNELSSGQVIIVWEADTGGNANNKQTITCGSSHNQIYWTFENFWFTADRKPLPKITLTSHAAVTPKSWSHHLIRFNSHTGLLEYAVDGEDRALCYTTANGEEDGEVYTPVVGRSGVFLVGSDFDGIIDDISIYQMRLRRPHSGRYANERARIVTQPLDMGAPNSTVLNIDATGGLVTLGTRMANHYQDNGAFTFDNGAQIQFFARTSNDKYNFTSPWRTFNPGDSFLTFTGHYIQIACDFYASGDKESAPYLSSMAVTYKPLGFPPAPQHLAAVAHDGRVTLSWRERKLSGVAGYILYYGTRSGEYFGEGATQGASPIVLGHITTITLDNLQNGTLYYFTVASYDMAGPAHAGAFSREVSARPLEMLE
jgi:hypothetical protein